MHLPEFSDNTYSMQYVTNNGRHDVDRYTLIKDRYKKSCSLRPAKRDCWMAHFSCDVNLVETVLLMAGPGCSVDDARESSCLVHQSSLTSASSLARRVVSGQPSADSQRSWRISCSEQGTYITTIIMRRKRCVYVTYQ